MITRLIWTIWTSPSAVPRKAGKFNHSLTRARLYFQFSQARFLECHCKEHEIIFLDSFCLSSEFLFLSLAQYMIKLASLCSSSTSSFFFWVITSLTILLTFDAVSDVLTLSAQVSLTFLSSSCVMSHEYSGVPNRRAGLLIFHFFADLT